MNTHPLLALDKSTCQRLRIIFTDIDDTVSLEGKIPWEAYRALWEAKEVGMRVIPVTGRSAGWVDHITRMWPVDAVVGENGAFYFYLDTNKGRDAVLVRRFLQEESVRKENQRKLFQCFKELQRKIPHLQLANDQCYREIDLAVDFCEACETLSEKEIVLVQESFEAQGAQSKLSSIHINSWFGDHNKYECCKIMLQELFKEDLETIKESCVYLGDSPNDEPFFKEFSNSIGVANIRSFLNKMDHKPQFITEKAGGIGFAEAITHILSHR